MSVFLAWPVFGDFVKELLPDVILPAMVHVVRCAPSELLYLVLQVLDIFAVPVHVYFVRQIW